MAVVQAGMPKRSGSLQATATLGALGVVYGDIGTSPLYALKEAARAAPTTAARARSRPTRCWASSRSSCGR